MSADGPAAEVVNPATGERVRFLRSAPQTDGELLVIEDYWPDPGHVVAEHLHPGIEERWRVLEGLVRFRIGTEERIAGPGEQLVAPAGVAHSSANAGEGPARLLIEMRPALRWEEFVRRLFAIGDDPDVAVRLIALLDEYSDEIAVPLSE